MCCSLNSGCEVVDAIELAEPLLLPCDAECLTHGVAGQILFPNVEDTNIDLLDQYDVSEGMFEVYYEYLLTVDVLGDLNNQQSEKISISLNGFELEQKCSSTADEFCYQFSDCLDDFNVTEQWIAEKDMAVVNGKPWSTVYISFDPTISVDAVWQNIS